MATYLLALGANCHGMAGSPAETFRWALTQLVARGFCVLRMSSLYDTAPAARSRQDRYTNAAVSVTVALPPARVLRIIKALERASGRVRVRSFGARPLDIDIIAGDGDTIGWNRRRMRPFRHVLSRDGTRPAPKRSGRLHLVVPHPLAHLRPFVLDPIAEIAPHWRHPALGRTLTQLRARLRRPPGMIRVIAATSYDREA